MENAEDAERHGTRPKGSRSAPAKLTEEVVARILLDAEAGATVVGLAAEHRIRKENISKILNGHHWRHVAGPRKVAVSDYPGYVKTADAASVLGVSRVTIQSLIKSGRLVAVQTRRGFAIEPTSLAVEAAKRCG